MGPAAAARRGEFQLLWLMQKIGLQIVLINSAPNVASFQMSNVSRQTLFKKWIHQSRQLSLRLINNVTRKKSPKVYKSCPKMIKLEKW